MFIYHDYPLSIIQIEEYGLAKYKPLINVTLMNRKIETKKNYKMMYDNNNILKLFNLQTGLVKSIKTKPRACPEDITVKRLEFWLILTTMIEHRTK